MASRRSDRAERGTQHGPEWRDREQDNGFIRLEPFQGEAGAWPRPGGVVGAAVVRADWPGGGRTAANQGVEMTQQMDQNVSSCCPPGPRRQNELKHRG